MEYINNGRNQQRKKEIEVEFDCFIEKINKLIPPTRPTSISVTHLETAKFWAMHSVDVSFKE